MSATRHAYTLFMVLFSRAIWETYSAEEQQILVDCAIVGRDVQREASRALSESPGPHHRGGLAQRSARRGLAEIRAAVQGVYDRHKDTIGAEVVDCMLAALEELRAQ